jgi:hypothetical protein
MYGGPVSELWTVRDRSYGERVNPSPEPPSIPGPACRLPEQLAENPCPRCGADMLWTKASWHCLRCRYKEGCC